ncbi:hypothetical protein ACFY9N_11325 [Microbacterium sp. NPDC008134]|uniref:hypothetical protein n=1 Tax=Microbacterium sp. NPDC008134 TaxID=3364183 RepID=UPI0036E6A3E9
MKSYQWNVVTGVLYLLTTVFLLLQSDAFTIGWSNIAWYTVATILVTVTASVVSFVTAWLDRRRSRGVEAASQDTPRIG